MSTGTAVLLAGGKSSRMGFDKQCLKLGDSLLVEQQVRTLRQIFQEIIIVTNKQSLYKKLDCIVTADELHDFGPLGGIHAGLKAASSEFCYFMACDMPNINIAFISHMTDIINRDKSYQAIVTRYGDWLEPFHAFYSKSLIPDIEQAYSEGRMRISEVLANVHTYYIPEVETRRYSPDWELFRNINTQEDLLRANKSCGKIVNNDI